MKKIMEVFLFLFFLMIFGGVQIQAQSVPLTNANFEDAFTEGAAPGWQSWVLSGSPIFLEEHGEWWVHNGTGRAQRFWSGAFDAGILQQVSVTPDTAYAFSIWMHKYAADEGGGQEKIYVQAGIDPSGGVNPNNVTWGEQLHPTSEYVQATAVVLATGNTITVYARGTSISPVYGERDVFCDDAYLEITTAPPTNTPTNTLAPPTNTPTDTPIPPTDTPASTCTLGDVDCTNGVTPGDALLAFNIFLGVDVTGDVPDGCDFSCAADYDQNSSVTPGDALCIFNVFLGVNPPCS